MRVDSARPGQPSRYIFYQHSRKVTLMPAKTINLARSPFKRHALSRATHWTLLAGPHHAQRRRNYIRKGMLLRSPKNAYLGPSVSADT